MSKELEAENLPPSYINLGFDATPVAGPSAPASSEDDGHYTVSSEPMPGPSAPKEEEAEKYATSTEPMPGPSAPKEEEAEKYAAYPKPGPTPSAPNIQQPPPPAYLSYSFPALAFEDVYEAGMNYVDDHCCYSSRLIRQMKLTDINNGCAFHYKLESFGEKRESSSRYEPYKGGPIDGPENGPAPDPWNMFVALPALFIDSKTQRDIPHTDHVSTCDKCNGRGKVTCSSCGGSGYDNCWSCSGSGRNSDGDRCTSCSGSGRKTCWSCSGSGRVTCSRCDGYGQIKRCRVLIVTWKNHPTDFISEVRKLPPDKIRKATGDTLFFEAEAEVLPLVNAPDVSVNVASTRMVGAHKISFPNELIRRQRHYLRAVPFVTVQYEWKETADEFYVYGKEKAVYFEDYPQKCCCCVCC